MELKIPHLIQGRTDKLTALKELAAQLKLAPAQCVYMGDDDIDATACLGRHRGDRAQCDARGAERRRLRDQPGRRAWRRAEICEHLLAARVRAPSL